MQLSLLFTYLSGYVVYRRHLRWYINFVPSLPPLCSLFCILYSHLLKRAEFILPIFIFFYFAFVLRYNYTFTRDTKLHTPWIPKNEDFFEPKFHQQSLFLRVERQCFHKIPNTNAVTKQTISEYKKTSPVQKNSPILSHLELA